MRQRKRSGSSRSAAPGHNPSIRIIAGRWRGSRLPVLDKKGLRPTPDRVRETVFNWLNLSLPGASVLDCFAGAGGLGLEAASREASKIAMVDLDRQVCASLQQQCDRLQAQSVSIHQSDILAFLDVTTQVFDLVFIDPPYDHPDLRQQVISRLVKRKLLAVGALLYLEWPNHQEMTLQHDNLRWVKQKTSASVCYAIAQWGDCG